MYGFTDEQLITIAETVRNNTKEELEAIELKADLRIESYNRIDSLINEHTHPSFRFGNVVEVKK